MVALRISEFQGAVPRTAPENLGGFEAQQAINCKLWSTKLKAWNGLENVTTVAAGIKSIFRLQGNWLVFASDVDVVPSQLAGDLTGRLFYTGLDVPRTTDLSRALIGETALNTPASTNVALPAVFINNATLASLGLAVGNTINASCQIQDPGALVVNGHIQVICYGTGGVVLSTTNGNNLQGCGEDQVSVLTGLVIPGGTLTITVQAVCTSSSAATARYCYLTMGNFSATALPVASIPLGIPQPPQPSGSTMSPSVAITGATSYNQNITNGGSVSVACDGTEIEVTGRLRFTATVNANANGDVTVTLMRGSTATGSKQFSFNCQASHLADGTASITGTFTLTDQPPSGTFNYSLQVTDNFSGVIVSSSSVCTGTLSYASAVDITCQGWASATNHNVGDTIMDSNGNIQYCLIAGTTKTGSHPAWTTGLGNTIVDGTVTWCLVSQMPANAPIQISGVRGMTAINGNTTFTSQGGTVIRVPINTQQNYSSGGTVSLRWGTQAQEANAEDRVYVITYVADLDGEAMESQASSATSLLTVAPSRPVDISFPATPNGYGITAVNLYRTVADGQGNATLTFVKQFATSGGNTPTDYIDLLDDTALGGTLTSASWLAPPADMVGLVALPNGVLVGFNSNTVIPSVPYQPQAYPEEYQLSTEFQIVAIKPFGQSLAVLTQGKPYVITGIDPSQWAMEAIDTIQPCSSKRSAVDMGSGVMYACPDGLAMISTEGVNLISRGFITRDTWSAMDPTSIMGARYQDSYVGFYTGNGGGGFIFDLQEQELTFLNFQATAIWTDPATGDLYMVVGTNLQEWDADAVHPLTYTWQSKNFVTPRPLNFGRGKVRADAYPVTFELYGDGNLVATVTVQNGNAFPLPSGYMAQSWSMLLTGTATIEEVVIAETAADLKQGISQISAAEEPVG